MISPVKEVSYGAGVSSRLAAAESSAEATFAELRDRVSSIAKEIAAIAEKRTRSTRDAAMETTEAGALELRKTIRRQPALAMAVAVGAGAIFALAIVPRFNHKPITSRRWDGWMPPVTRADLYEVADNIQRSVSRAAHAMPAVTPTFERLIDAITRTDPSASMSSVVEKASSWFQKLQARAAEKAK
jgi:hypothetical protein